MTRKSSACTFVVILAAAIGCSQNRPAVERSSDAPDTCGKPPSVRVAGIVLKWVAADKPRNFERLCPMVREAARQGARIVITTECFLDGYAIRDKSIPQDEWLALGEPIPDGDYCRRLRGLAAECRIWLVAGMLERAGERTHNAAVLIAPDGRLVGKYRKHDLGHELPRNTPGTEYPVFETPFGKVGLMICADRRNPELVRRLAANGAEILLCPSGGMWGPVKNDHHLQARSRENRVPIVFVHPIEFLVTDPTGEILDVRLTGDVMDVKPRNIDSVKDSRQIALFDLPLSAP